MPFLSVKVTPEPAACVLALTRPQSRCVRRKRTQTKFAAVNPSWGETFVYTAQELRAGDWMIFVEVC